MCRWPFLSLFAVLLVQQIRADVCKVFATRPDFSAPGRRVSEQKCREFNWERKRVEHCSEDATNMKYPYMGALGYKKAKDDAADGSDTLSFLCAGFLVSPKFVVTTAHCVRPIPQTLQEPPVFVRFGNDNIEDEVPRLDVKIARTIVHPQYKKPLKSYDIALVELESEVPFTRNTHPACLWSQTLENVEYGKNPAWGADSHRGKQRKLIAEMTVKVLDHETCLEKAKSLYTRLFRQLEEHQMCGDESVSEILNCQGSAGSPLITTANLDGNTEDQMPYAFGMSDFAQGCGNVGIYVKISSFIDWIEQNVWPAVPGDAGSAIHFRD